MKRIVPCLGAALALASLAVMSPNIVRADDDDATVTKTTTTTSTSAGTVSEFSPTALVIKSESSSQPVRYTFSKTTTYVDEAGNPVSVESVRSGIPVTVSYYRSGDEMIASRVIVRRAPEVQKTTTTSTTIKKDDD